jgi:hypothetical protein
MGGCLIIMHKAKHFSIDNFPKTEDCEGGAEAGAYYIWVNMVLEIILFIIEVLH